MADIGHQWTSRAFVEGSRQMSVVGVAIAFMIITAVVVGLRMWVRIYIINGVSADDCEFDSSLKSSMRQKTNLIDWVVPEQRKCH